MFLAVWKFQDFSVTQILREINVGESRNSKTAVFAILEFWQFSKFQITKSAKINENQNSASKSVKVADFALLETPKIISNKTCVVEKSWKFHTVRSRPPQYVFSRIWKLSSILLNFWKSIHLLRNHQLTTMLIDFTKFFYSQIG